MKRQIKNNKSYLNANKWRTIGLISLLVLLASLSHTQSNDSLFADRPLRSINVGLLGDASHISVSYEQIFFNKPYFFYTAEVGFGYNRDGNICVPIFCTGKEILLTVPFHLTANFGNGNHFLEMGMGATKIFGDTPYGFFLFPQLGYRYMPSEPFSPNVKAYFQLFEFMGFDLDEVFYSPIGVSIGLSF